MIIFPSSLIINRVVKHFFHHHFRAESEIIVLILCVIWIYFLWIIFLLARQVYELEKCWKESPFRGMRHLVNCVYLGTFRENRDDCLSKDAALLSLSLYKREDNILRSGNKSLKGMMICSIYGIYDRGGEEERGGFAFRTKFQRVINPDNFSVQISGIFLFNDFIAKKRIESNISSPLLIYLF